MNYLIFTYHTSSNSNGDQVLKFGHILLGLLIEGIDEVTDPSQERNQQKNLHNIVPCQSSTVITFSFYQSPKLGITVPLMPIYNIIVNSPSPNSHLHAYTYQFDGMQWSKVETRFDTEAMAKGESSKDPEDDTDTKENGCVFKTEREVHFIMAAGISSRSLVKST